MHAVSLTTANTCNVMTIMSLPSVTNELYDLMLTKTNSILQSIRGRDFFLHRVSGSRVLWTVKGADTPPTCIIIPNLTLVLACTSFWTPIHLTAIPEQLTLAAPNNWISAASKPTLWRTPTLKYCTRGGLNQTTFLFMSL